MIRIETNKSPWNTEELNQWREELHKLTECRDALSGAELSAAYYARRPHFQNYVKNVVEEFGAERVNTVLGYTVRHFDYDGRFDRRVKDWAQRQPRVPQPPRPASRGDLPPRDFHELISNEHPVILNFVCKMQMESDPVRENPANRKNRGESR